MCWWSKTTSLTDCTPSTSLKMLATLRWKRPTRTKQSLFWKPVKTYGLCLRTLICRGSMDGLKLAHAIRERWPPIELILTSGHFDLSDDEIPERGRFFPKPYRDQEIISALQHFAA